MAVAVGMFLLGMRKWTLSLFGSEYIYVESLLEEPSKYICVQERIPSLCMREVVGIDGGGRLLQGQATSPSTNNLLP